MFHDRCQKYIVDFILLLWGAREQDLIGSHADKHTNREEPLKCQVSTIETKEKIRIPVCETRKAILPL